MPLVDGKVSFVVVGETPAALAVPASEVTRILSPEEFEGPRLYLEDLTAGSCAEDAPRHLLVVNRAGGVLGLLVRGRLEIATFAPGEILALPPIVASRSRMSHVLARGGRPLVPVLHVAVLDDSTFSSTDAQPDWQEAETRPC